MALGSANTRFTGAFAHGITRPMMALGSANTRFTGAFAHGKNAGNIVE